MKKGFTLIEMLVVIGIIAILMAAGVGGYMRVTKHAQKARGRELVSNTATALSVLFQQQGRWPAALRTEAGGGKGRLTARAAACLAVNKLMPLTSVKKEENGETFYTLSGLDRCGIVSPWAAAVIKRMGPSEGALGAKVPSGGTVQDHILYYAIDLDGDGITEAMVEGGMVKVRANACVWCAGMDGKLDDYSLSGRSDDIYSWTKKQEEN